MGKKSGTTYVSKGERVSVNKSITKAMRRDYMESLDRITNQLKAWKQGKRVMLTIANPNKKDTRARFIRVEAQELLVDPRGNKNKSKSNA